MTPLQFVLKTASRCNLNCSYCYVYNKGNDSWRGRPALMPDHVFDASVERIRRYCERSGQPTVSGPSASRSGVAACAASWATRTGSAWSCRPTGPC